MRANLAPCFISVALVPSFNFWNHFFGIRGFYPILSIGACPDLNFRIYLKGFGSVNQDLDLKENSFNFETVQQVFLLFWKTLIIVPYTAKCQVGRGNNLIVDITDSVNIIQLVILLGTPNSIPEKENHLIFSLSN